MLVRTATRWWPNSILFYFIFALVWFLRVFEQVRNHRLGTFLSFGHHHHLYHQEVEPLS